jgi:hypothetical protein
MNDQVSLEVALSLEMLEVFTGVVHSTARAYGLKEPALDHAILAAEEVFVYLVSHPGESPILRLTIKNGGYYVRISFAFSPTGIPTHVLNVSMVSDPKDPKSLEGLEIFIAGRIADRFIYDRSDQEKTRIHLIIEKYYPEQTEILPQPEHVPATMTFTRGMNLEIKQAATRIVNRYGDQAPVFFRFPGKVADMVTYGDLSAMIATDGKGTVFGGIFWKLTERRIDMYGPYLFVPAPDLGENLVQSMLEIVGRSGAISVINRSPTPDTPESWFEELPPMEWQKKDPGDLPALMVQRPLYRDLGEDTGTSVIIHSDLVAAAKKWYSQMCLMRQIITVDSAGEHSEDLTSFYVEINKNIGSVLLTACVIGDDVAETLREHLVLLREGGCSDILYEMDLSKETDAAIYPVLRDAGFAPEYILPWGGQKDTMIFRYHQDMKRC